MSAADPATEEDFFLPGSTAQRGLASSDLDESWESRDVRTSMDLTMDDSNPLPPGALPPHPFPLLSTLRQAAWSLGGDQRDWCISAAAPHFERQASLLLRPRSSALFAASR